MKIEEAIERIQHDIKNHPINQDQNLRTALNLGIEALKRVQDIRERRHSLGGEDLPGETGEN